VSVPVFPYGSAANPLQSIHEDCPGCHARPVVADLSPPPREKVEFAEASLTSEALDWWRSLCTVSCGCGWIGSAFRPEEAMAA
jgi:hypothetical protein